MARPQTAPSGFVLDQFTTGAAQQLLNETGGIDTAPEIRVLENGLLERDRGFDAGDHVFAKARLILSIASRRSLPCVISLAIMES
jgi:hypothetical protein